ITAALAGLRKYPDPLAHQFRLTAGNLLGVDPACIVPVNGSDEALTLLTRICCGPDDTMVSPTPSYLLYKVLAEIQGCRFAEVPFDVKGDLPDDFAAGAALAFIPNPNSPTGTMIPPERIRRLLERTSGLLVIDEAYADFAEANCISLVKNSDRLVVLRTLSKS